VDKIVIELPKPVVACNDCLPHAAMNLGSARGVGITPRAGMVSRLVIQPQAGAWCFFRMDKDGGFVGESWHPTKEDAIYQARKEFGIETEMSDQ
jgi:hypothetical protein